MQNKLVVTALGAFGFGALMSWAITADIYELRLDKEHEGCDDLIANKTEHIWALQDRLDNPPKEAPDYSDWGVIDSTPTETETISTETEAIPTEDPNQMSFTDMSDSDGIISIVETVEETRSNLEKLIDTYTADQDTKAGFVDKATNSIEQDKVPPFVISRATYAWDEEGEHYDKITLTYFPNDRVLLDDEEDPIEDVAATVGWRSLSQFGGESEDPDVVFIRNRRMEVDFEVIKEENKSLPLHIKYGMEKEEFRVNKAAGTIKLRREDE